MKILSLVLNLFFLALFLFPFLGFINKKSVKKGSGIQRHAYAIIPAHNEENVIANLINDCKATGFDGVFVVTDACTDRTVKKALKEGARVYEVHERNKGKAIGKALPRILNKLNDTDALYFFDADTRLPKDFLSKSLPYLGDYDIIIHHLRIPASNRTWVSRMYIILYAYLYKFQSALSLIGVSNIIPGNGWACTVRVLKDNPFNVDTLVDDLEYTLKIKVPVRFIDDGIVLYNEAPETWGVSWKQRLRWTRGGFQLLFGDYSSYAFSKSFVLLFPLASLFYTFSFLQSLLHPVSFLINLPTALLINMLFYGLFLDKEDWEQIKLYDLISFFFFSLSQYVIIIIALFTYREQTWVRTLHKGGNIRKEVS